MSSTNVLLEAYLDYKHLHGKVKPDDTMQEMQVRLSIVQKYRLGLFDLDRVITQVNVHQLTARLKAEHEGRCDLTDPLRKFYEIESHQRNLPDFALPLILSDCVAPEAERELLIYAWTTPEFPEEGNKGNWMRAFGRSFITDDDSLVMPREPIRLWRGAVPAYAHGLAWTDDKGIAQWFANRFGPGPDNEIPQVWSIVVPPEGMLARFVGRGESEWVVHSSYIALGTDYE